MLKTKFSSLCVYVVYKYNRLTIECPPEGLTARDVLRLACAQLQINAGTMHIERNRVALSGKESIMVFSVLDLVENAAQSDHPSLRKLLWQISHTDFSQEATLKTMAREMYEEMLSAMRRVAHYGRSEEDFVLRVGEPNCPPTWIYVMRYYEPLAYTVLKHLKAYFHEEGLYPSVQGDRWSFDWQLASDEIVHIALTARDLIAMGYNPANGRSFYYMMNRLRGAIIEGSVSDHFAEAQRDWIRSHFPLPK